MADWTATVRDSAGGIHARRYFQMHPADGVMAAIANCYYCWSPAGIYRGEVEPSLEVVGDGVRYDVFGAVLGERAA